MKPGQEEDTGNEIFMNEKIAFMATKTDFLNFC